MKISEYENRAGEMLKGKWGLVIGTTFVANLLGGVSVEQFDVQELLEKSGVDLGNFNLLDRIFAHMSPESAKSISVALVIAGIILVVISLIFGGATKAGLCRFNKNLCYDTNPKFKDIFTHYNKIGKTIWTTIVQTLYISLWSLFGIVPGLIIMFSALELSTNIGAIFSTILVVFGMVLMVIPAGIALIAYSMTFYILDENPDMSAGEAVEASKNLMDGHKKRLFVLYLNFFGILVIASIIPFGIGMLFYNPYWLAAEYIFYDSIAHVDENEKDENIVIDESKDDILL